MNEYLIKKLKEGRSSAGLKQNEVAKRIGIKGNTLSNYENGVSEPDIDTFCALCDIYNLDPAEILGEAYGLGVQGSDFSIKPSEIDHIKKYRDLDTFGQETVSIALNRETKRVESLAIKDQRIAELESDQGVPGQAATLIELQPYRNNVYPLPYFRGGISAGSGVFVLGNEATEKIEIPDIPEYKGTDYAVDVKGRSMEPDYMDGDIVLVSQKKEMHPGDVGIFIVDSSAYIKELGHTELISRNKDFPNISIQESNNVVCMGKVIGKLKRNKK